ncbi:MAG: hypothetical protein WD646_03790 [Actinomycetota bacterium]
MNRRDGSFRIRGRAAGVLAAVILVVGVPARAAFPGPNGSILFESDRDPGDVWSMEADGSAATNLTNSSAGSTPVRAEASPDGATIAFDTNRDGNREIYLMAGDGSGQHNITNEPSGEIGPAWSPDGNRIAFLTDRDHAGVTTELYVMNADGSNAIRLTNNEEIIETNPAWSPDSSKIAFQATEPGVGIDILTVNPDGTGAANLTTDMSEAAGEPDWTPDGNAIFFSHAEEIWRMNADGTGKTPVITGHFDHAPQVSPDGTKLTYQRLVPADDVLDSEVIVANIDGSGQVNITNRAGFDAPDDWSVRPGSQSEGPITGLLRSLGLSAVADLLCGFGVCI